ncbi:Tyrocidine synthase 3 [Micromonospora sp. MW-13]|uniref:non-ribosomal peptide synthetase n=1 Tax=Micromonospora sp. MW-13 TaxID=2094022 RepID=UPI000E446CAF|nr:non-ribosomal peptide synthetase [Micromonospora sp. MW-13]RGC66838.1 Tyrocidine synthase 3 [Micromonospora sp. MW-13]
MPEPTQPSDGARDLERSAKLKRLINVRLRATEQDSMRRRNPDCPVASYAQERLWLTEQLIDEHSAYNVHHAFCLRGPVDAVALERAVTEVVRRHAVLRTVFTERDGELELSTKTDSWLDFEYRDLVGHDGGAEELSRLVDGSAFGVFDLRVGPLVRGLLVRVGVEEFAFVFVAHHIVVDGWSMGVLWDELSHAYRAAAGGEVPGLPEVSLEYSDFASWQREWLESGVAERQLAYWRERLAGLVTTEIPGDRSRPVVGSGRGGVVDFVLPEVVARRLRGVARDCGATLFMVMLAGWYGVLTRWCGTTDVAVGTPVAGRSRVELERMVGFFVNTLVLRVDLAGDPRFSDLVRRVRDVAVSAYAHQDVPFERLVEQLVRRREPGRTPFFQVMFSVEDGEPDVPRLPGIAVTPMPLGVDTAKFDLGVGVRVDGDRIIGTINYSADLFDRDTAQRLAAHYTTLLTAAAASPGAPLSALGLLSADERDHLIQLGTGPEAAETLPYLHEVIAAQARRDGESVAVVWDGGELTYRELDRQVEAVRESLGDNGIGPESVVGILMERSPAVIVSMIAVLAAGGAFVLIDPAYPVNRIERIVTLSGAEAVVVRDGVRADGPPASVTVIDFDSAANRPVDPSARTAGQRAADPDTLAYLAFTSGSTGEPKGVMITHRGLSGMMLDVCDRLELTPRDTMGAIASQASDVVIVELLAPLTCGARVAVLSREVAADGDQFAAAIDRYRVTVTHASPATSSLLPDGWNSAELRISSGGATLPGDLAQRLVPRVHTLWNVYGPAEATVYTTMHTVKDSAPGVRVPIGRPIRGATVRILDDHGQLTPISVQGELVIGGLGVARGYVGRPGLTAERFVPDPYGPPGSRVYRTGDLASWSADGSLMYGGRQDHQVQLHGHRVELGEIEAALSAHPAVAHAVVAVRGEERDPELAGYVVWQPGSRAAWSELRAHLRVTLPDHMVPTVFATLDRLPLTPTGKVDRAALPDVVRNRPERTYVPPRDDIGKLVAGVWERELEVDRVGLDDDFFELGGHSLRAARVVSRLRQALRIELAMKTLFEFPVLAGFVDAVKGAGREAQSEIPKRPDDVQARLSASQLRLWFLYNLDPNRRDYNSYVALRLSGALDEQAFADSLSYLVTRHEILRSRIHGRDDNPSLITLPPGSFRTEVVDLTGVEPERLDADLSRLVDGCAFDVFDLRAGPLVRGLLVRTGVEDFVFVFAAHHVAVDAWSMEILWDELSRVYGVVADGGVPDLPDVSVRYSDFAYWQRDWLDSGVAERQLAYWRGQLAGLVTARVPADRPRPITDSGRGGVVDFSVPDVVAARLRGVARECGATLFMVMLAGWCGVLARWCGTTDVAVGTPVAGRNRVEIERTVGFFVNTLVLRMDLSGDPDFTELVRRARDVALDAYANQDVPFERLVERLTPRREPGRTPFFQVMFSAAEGGPSVPELPGLKVSPMPLGAEPAKFDLAVGVRIDDGRIAGAITYSADLFDHGTARRLADHYTTLLTAAAAAPNKPLNAFHGTPAPSSAEPM